jgi:hypothetical protein
MPVIVTPVKAMQRADMVEADLLAVRDERSGRRWPPPRWRIKIALIASSRRRSAAAFNPFA